MRAKTAAFGGSLWLVLLVSGASHADTFTPISLGTLPDGLVAENCAFTLDPGVCTPWHVHPGPLWVTLTAGQLTEDTGPVRYRAFSSTLHPVPALFALCSAAQSSSFLASDFTSSRLLDKANGKAATAV